MHASTVLQRCLDAALAPIHASRRRVLLGAVDALIAGRRLTLMDLARSWLGAERVRAPLKALDRLLGNRHLQREREQIYASMAQWLMRHRRPLILIDWSDLKPDGSWHVLRAAVPVGGRALPILDMVFPGGMQGSPQAEGRFLQRLIAIVPPGVKPILVTDAGFRIPWFRAVSALGWSWVGRLRHRTRVKPADEADHPSQWLPCKVLYALVTRAARDLGLMHLAASQAWLCRMILHSSPPKGRKCRNRAGQPARRKHSLHNAQREREPWLLVASPDLGDLNPQQLVAIYARRMQIECSFRDLKSHRYGHAYEDSLTRKGSRIDVLLLISALATFASWLIGLACRSAGLDRWLSPCSSNRPLYSIVWLGHQALLRHWPTASLYHVMRRLQDPYLTLLEQCGVSA